jgi:hypothetical protein
MKEPFYASLDTIYWRPFCVSHVMLAFAATGHVTMQADLEMAAPRCGLCAFVMPSHSSSTRYRCGYHYFQLPLIQRKFKTMSHYPEVQLLDGCKRWRNQECSNRLTHAYF